MYGELIIRTQYDGRDYMSVEEIYYIDEDGNDVVCREATDACIDITTCADQGDDLWNWMRSQIEMRLKNAGIGYEFLNFED